MPLTSRTAKAFAKAAGKPEKRERKAPKVRTPTTPCARCGAIYGCRVWWWGGQMLDKMMCLPCWMKYNAPAGAAGAGSDTRSDRHRRHP